MVAERRGLWRTVPWRGPGLLAAVSLLLVLTHVWIRLQVQWVGYALSGRREVAHRLQGERQWLEGEWSAHTAPKRLAEQALRRLGLRVAHPEQIVRMPGG